MSDTEAKDTVLPIDSVMGKKRRKSKKSTDVDDIVDALLGGELEHAVSSKKQRKKKKKKSKPVEEEPELTASNPVSDDDVPDLYSWDTIEEETKPAEKPTESAPADAISKEERMRTMQLALAAAEASETSNDPKTPADWFDKLNHEPAVVKSKLSADGDLTAATLKPKAELPKEKREMIGRYLAMDCEMVGAGFKGCRSMLARVSIVNYYGHVVLDTFVKPTEPVTDYRTWISGVRKSDLQTGRDFAEVQKQVADLLKDRILVGHALKNDLAALMLTHPPLLIRDTAKYPPFKDKKSSQSLRRLAASVLHITIQEGEHSSIVDAKTAMLLYRKVKAEWEQLVAPRRYKAQVVKVKTKERFARLREEIKQQQN
ncbi:3'-5' exonuclease [Coemansia sp. RSA 2336]|nr:3'-5' exonuclease [Coemansia sp. RSA 2336]